MECRENGCQAGLFPDEGGFPAQSVWSMLTTLSISGKECTIAMHRIRVAAERDSCWFWHKREEARGLELMSSDLATTTDPTGRCRG